MSPAGGKRLYSEAGEPITQLQHRYYTRTRKHESLSTEQEMFSTVTSSTSTTAGWQAPNNLQASLLGLPAELRLEVYSHLYDTLIVHVHHYSKKKASRFTWTPCRAASELSRLLCANPKWSGLCKEEDRCTYEAESPRELTGAWALAASNRLIRQEAHELFFRKSVVSIHPQDLAPWLDHLTERDPRQVENLRHVTLASPNFWKAICKLEFDTVRTRIPNLQSLGVQCQNPLYHWVNMSDQPRLKAGEVDFKKWHEWNIVGWVRGFDPTITIVLQAMIWREPRGRERKRVEKQSAIHILWEGKALGTAFGTAWSDTDITFNTTASNAVAPCTKDTGWKQWWQGKGMERWTTLSPFCTSEA
jgi:hypothetical protein